MEWIEAQIKTTAEEAELVGLMLIESGVDGFRVEDEAEMRAFIESNPLNWDYVDDELLRPKEPDGHVSLIFYVSANAHGRAILDKVNQQFEGGVELKTVNDEDWIDNWKAYFKPLAVGENIIIRPVWEELAPQPGKLVFHINPGHVFGTGLHQTTKLCIIELERRVKKGCRLLDLGCGSGILSILGLMLGADFAQAIDLDPNAVDVAYENAAINGIQSETYQVRSGNVKDDDVQAVLGQGYDIVVANIVADVIIGITPLVPKWLKPNGLFISSGIIGQRLDEVKACLVANNFKIIDIAEMDDWFCIVAL